MLFDCSLFVKLGEEAPRRNPLWEKSSCVKAPDRQLRPCLEEATRWWPAWSDSCVVADWTGSSWLNQVSFPFPYNCILAVATWKRVHPCTTVRLASPLRALAMAHHWNPLTSSPSSICVLSIKLPLSIDTAFQPLGQPDNAIAARHTLTISANLQVYCSYHNKPLPSEPFQSCEIPIAKLINTRLPVIRQHRHWQWNTQRWHAFSPLPLCFWSVPKFQPTKTKIR